MVEIVGYTSGIFDLFHKGHENYLQLCRQYCDYLIVGVDSDSRTKALKGEGRPIENASIRMKHVKEHCDLVFEKLYPSRIYFEMFKPAILFRSFDGGKPIIHSDLKTLFFPYTVGISTTIIISTGKITNSK
ncbi:adenylyltransferase/cytidyltransferase family protein [Pantoea ananatis]|uniref:adenylyltransferase/cytidyltransferase family protein n=1 Tax=Pantoea ananas TaxID=553 RepID=UPI003BB4A5F0